MSYKVIDNFLPQGISEDIKSVMSGQHHDLTPERFYWHYNADVTGGNEDNPYDFQFTHMFFYRHKILSNFTFLLDPILDLLEAKAIVRIKGNLLTRTPEHYETGYHVDYKFPCKTAVYYVNTNNGHTQFQNGKKVEAVQNRLLLFDSQEPHTSVTSTDTKARMVINFNYF